MKSQILKILEMQEQGKITRDQAAELLAILADQAREKAPPHQFLGAGEAATHDAATAGEGSGASGPQAAGKESGPRASAAIHDFVDAAIGMGTTVGRVASVWGTEFMNMVHRDEGGNSVTLSKIDTPAGEAYRFRENVANVSKVADLKLQQAEFCGNTFNASKVSGLAITRGRFSSCQISGSSLTHLTIEGNTDEPPLPSGIHALVLNASKFSRIGITGGSAMEGCTIQASAVKEVHLGGQSQMERSKINDSSVSGLHMEKSRWTNVAIERSGVQLLKLQNAAMESVSLTGIKAMDVRITGGSWKNVKLRREVTGRGGEVRETKFDNCTLDDCDFINCTFVRSTLRNLKLRGQTVRNIDFTGMTLDSEEAFRKAAGVTA